MPPPSSPASMRIPTAGHAGDHPARPGRLDATRRLDPGTYFLVLECIKRITASDLAARLPDADAIADIAFRRVEAGRATVADPDRYHAWVSVVCRNTYLNFVRSRRNHRALDDGDAVHDPQSSLDGRHDAPIIRHALVDAIGRLPRFLREVARLRFVEERSHAAIARKTGMEIPIVRAYASRAASRLRDDDRLMALLRDWRG